MSEAKLPFLLVHGAWVWRIAQLGVAIALVAAFGALRRFRTRRRVRADVAWQRRSATPLVPGPVTLVGYLRGGSLMTVVQSYRQTSTRDGTPWLDVGGARIELASEVHVEAGSSFEG